MPTRSSETKQCLVFMTIYKYTDLQPTCTLQIGLQGYASMPQALSGLSRAERITYCNDEVPLASWYSYPLNFSCGRQPCMAGQAVKRFQIS